MPIHIPVILAIAAAKAAKALLERLSGQGAELPEHVVRVGGDLQPVPGYAWTSETPGDFTVVWTPGKRWPERRLIAGSGPDKWAPEAGYAWVNPENPASLDVRWQAGRELTDVHLMTGHTEGEWHPAPGYDWVYPETPGRFDVRWLPGKPHSRAPHVLAATYEGRWIAETGWRWVSRDRDDLRVEPTSGGARRDPAGPDLQRLKDLGALGLDEEATRSEIDSAFRRLVKVHHPDRFNGQAEDAIQAAAQAFQLLRTAYNRLTAGGRS